MIEQTTDAQSNNRWTWWSQWRWVLPLMMLGSLLGVFYYPVYPDIYPFVAGLFVLTVLSLLLVLFAFDKSGRWEAAYKNDGTTKVKRLYKPLAALIASAAALYFLVFFSFSTIIQDVALIASILSSTIFVGIFVFVWPTRRASFERLFSRRWGIWLLVALVVALSSAVFLASWALVPRLLSGSPASWSTMLTFAQREAEKHINDARLDTVSASRNYYTFASPASEYPWEVTFGFSGQNGRVDVEVIDSNPPRLKRIFTDHLTSSSTSQYGTLNYESKLAGITLGPRQIYQATEAEGLQPAEKLGADPDDIIVDASLHMDLDWQERLGIPTVWAIHYQVGLESTDLHVDAGSGKVVERDYLNFDDNAQLDR